MPSEKRSQLTELAAAVVYSREGRKADTTGGQSGALSTAKNQGFYCTRSVCYRARECGFALLRISPFARTHAP